MCRTSWSNIWPDSLVGMIRRAGSCPVIDPRRRSSAPGRSRRHSVWSTPLLQTTTAAGWPEARSWATGDGPKLIFPGRRRTTPEEQVVVAGARVLACLVAGVRDAPIARTRNALAALLRARDFAELLGEAWTQPPTGMTWRAEPDDPSTVLRTPTDREDCLSGLPTAPPGRSMNVSSWWS